MTIHDFNRLSDEVQQAYVFQVGTYLVRRWDDVHQAHQSILPTPVSSDVC